MQMNISKKQAFKKSPSSSQARISKCTGGSVEGRDQNNRLTINKRSKEKIKETIQTVTKHYESVVRHPIVPTSTIQQPRRSMANVRQIELSLVDPKEDYKAKYYTLKQREMSQKVIGKCGSYKQFSTESNEKQQDWDEQKVLTSAVSAKQAVGKNSKLKCFKHSNKDAVFVVDIVPDEDVLCCEQCGEEMAVAGYSMENIQSVKSKRNYEIDEILSKSLQSMATLRQCLQHLPAHRNNVLNELKQQMDAHDGYYSKLIELITRRKEQTQKILMKCLNNLTEYFDKLHSGLHSQLSQIEKSYETITSSKEDIGKIAEPAFQEIVENYKLKLVVPDNILNPEIESWRVETGDVSQFQKDIQKYMIKLWDQNNPKPIVTQPQPEPVNSSLHEDSSFLCNEELEWGYKPPIRSIAPPPSKDIYFSFEKKNKDQEVSSPAFKQI